MSRTRPVGECENCGRSDVPTHDRWPEMGPRLKSHRKVRTDKHSAWCSGVGRSPATHPETTP